MHKAFPKIVLPCLVAIVFSSLILAAYLPAYSDEIGIKIIQARYFLDDGIASNLQAQCLAAYQLQPPAFMRPVLAAQSLLYGSSEGIFRLRLWGIAFALVVLALAAICSARLLRERPGPYVGFALPLAIFTLGAVPFVSVMNRTEQPMAIVTLLALFAPVLIDWRARPIRDQFAAVLAIFICWAVVLTQHPKSLVLLPLFAVVTWLMVRKAALRIGAFAGLAIFAGQALMFWQGRLSCPEDAMVQADLQREAVFPAGFWRDLTGTAERLISNVLGIPRYWQNIEFRSTYLSTWMPNGSEVPWLNIAILSLFLIMLLVVVGACLRLVVISIRRQEISSSQLLLVVGTMTLFAMAALQQTKSFNETVLVVPLLVSLFVLAIREWPAARVGRGVTVFVSMAALIGLFSQIAWWWQLHPRLSGAWQESGYVSDQPLSVSFARPDDLRRDVLAAAKQCGIEPASRLQHVVIDDSTYPVFIETRRPLHTLYVAAYFGRGIPDLREFLRRRGSDGVITDCRWYPERLKQGMQQLGRYCCHPGFRDAPSDPNRPSH